MKVVVAHNRYQSSQPSGENAVVDADIAMLREAGVEVIPFIKDSDSLVSTAAKLKAATGPVWSPAVRELAQLLDDEKPDVLHLHNVYPLISPWAVRTAKARGVRVVQTMHNYRHQCVAGTHFRDGKVCEDCTPTGLGLAAVQHGCYRGSRVQSAAMVAGRALHRTTWQLVEHYFALTPFMADRLAATGIAADRISIRPTSCADPGPPSPPTEKRVLFVGRLEQEKGVPLLLEAWIASTAAALGWRLVVVGSGALEDNVRRAAATDPSIELLGQLTSGKVAEQYRRAALVAMPFATFDGFPLVFAEAASHGRAVMRFRTGSLTSVVGSAERDAVEARADVWAARFSDLDLEDCRRDGEANRLRFDQMLNSSATRSVLVERYRGLAHP